jgi:tetratricopeptide (TPR) repeat protein
MNIKKLFFIFKRGGSSEVSTEADSDEDKKQFFSKAGSFLLLCLFFLMPVILIPSSVVHFLFFKQIIFSSIVVLVFLMWILGHLKDGRYELLLNSITLSLFGVVLVTLISALFSDKIWVSIIGQGFEGGTFVALITGFLTVFILPVFLNNKGKIFSAYVALFSAFVLVSAFQILRTFFSSDIFSFGFFNDPTSNLIGKWNDLAVFFGLTTILSVITLEFLSLSRTVKVLSYLTLVVSLVFLMVINFSSIWIVLGIFAVILFVFLFSFLKENSVATDEGKHNSKRFFPKVSLVLCLISVVFVIFGGYINNVISSRLKISQLEVRPSWQATFSVAKGSLGADPILGVGPNRFLNSWLEFKDPSVNSTMFWNSDFGYGVGFVPTVMITTGLLGIIAWLVFLASIILTGLKAVFVSSLDRKARYFTASSFFSTLFLWIFCFIYIPSNAIFALTFLMTGLFLASLIEEKIIVLKKGSYTHNSKVSFVSVLFLICIFVVTFIIQYSVIQRFVASIYFQQGLLALNQTGNIDRAEGKILKAVSFSKNDLFFRALSEIGLIKVQNIVSGVDKSSSSEETRTKFQNVLGNTLNYAKESIALDENNYENYISLARVYESIVPLKIEGAYEASADAYKNALKVNPHNPAIFLMMARLEIGKGNNKEARNYIAKSLAEKPNYTDAIFMLSQIEASEGNIKASIKSVESATVLAPNDPTVFFQLGLLRFNNKEYTAATEALGRALALNPLYANAKYFLGLSYEKIGKYKDAIAQFTDLSKTNPDNKEVGLILTNLKAGRPPFSNASSPIDDKPEKRSKPPIDEKSNKSASVEKTN